MRKHHEAIPKGLDEIEQEIAAMDGAELAAKEAEILHRLAEGEEPAVLTHLLAEINMRRAQL